MPYLIVNRKKKKSKDDENLNFKMRYFITPRDAQSFCETHFFLNTFFVLFNLIFSSTILFLVL